jgi:putative hydrolase of the HAD superfamily
MNRGGVETVLLDAGGVLLDLDYSYLVRLCRAYGVQTDANTLSRHEARARVEIHRAVQGGARVGDMWRTYFHQMLTQVGVPEDDQPEFIDSLWEAHQKFGLWSVAIEGAIETVRALKERGYRIGVVSNAEGRVGHDLERAGFDGMFETIVDSHHVGVEKPDPKIFQIAMERMGVGVEAAIFVGDVPAVDIVGAQRAQLRPLLIDRHDLYPEVEVPRLSSIAELSSWLLSSSES